MFNKWWDLLIGILIGLFCGGIILLVSRSKPGTAILLRQPPTQAPIVINVDGAVHYPGVYSLPQQSRVMDAVESAGGLREDAQVGSINLAALLEDGSHIFIPYLKKESSSEENGKTVAYGLSSSGEIIPLVNINQATLEELVALPGIGPVTAEKIILYRAEQAFMKIEEIQKVPGIGPVTFENIKDYLTVGE